MKKILLYLTISFPAVVMANNPDSIQSKRHNSLGIFISPTMEWQYSRNIPVYTFGIGHVITFFKYFQLEHFVKYSSKKIALGEKEYVYFGAGYLETYDVNLYYENYLGIGGTARFLLPRKKVVFFAAPGFTVENMFSLKEIRTRHYPNGLEVSHESKYKGSILFMISSLHFSTGADFYLKNGLSIRIEPSYRYYYDSGFFPENYSSVGLNLGCYYSF